MEYIYVALCLEDPRNTGTGNTIKEPHGGGYERVKTDESFWSANLEKKYIKNIRTITFPVASRSWGMPTHFAILDSELGGTMLGYGVLSKPQRIHEFDSAQITNI